MYLSFNFADLCEAFNSCLRKAPPSIAVPPMKPEEAAAGDPDEDDDDTGSDINLNEEEEEINH
jgi:hypothetical protein